MKLKKFLPQFVIITVALFFLRELFFPGFPFTHDGHNHLARLANLWLTLKSGQFPPRFAPNLDHGFGYPVFNFNYYLPYFLALPFKFFNLSFEISLKASLILFYAFGGLGIYSWLSRHLSRQASTLAAIIYLSAPYQLLNIFVRGNLGEIAALSILPWVFWSLDRLKPKNPRLIVQAALITAAFWLSHNLVTLVGLPLIAIYHLAFNLPRFHFKSWLKLSFTLFFFTFALGAFFYLPAIYEKKFITLDQTGYRDHYQQHFVYPQQLITTSWNFGYSVAGPEDDMDFSLGRGQLIIAAVSLIILITRRKKTSFGLAVFFSLVLIASIFLMLPISQPLYHLIKPLRYLQFPWRWLLLSPLALAVIASFGFNQLKSKKSLTLITLLLSSLLIFQAWPWSKAQSLMHNSDQNYYDFIFTSSVLQENTSIWFYREKNLKLPTAYVLERNHSVQPQILKWNAKTHLYRMNYDQEMDIVEHTAYFPGWQAFIDDQPIEINYQDKQYPGLISFKIPPGDHLVKTIFTQKTPARILGNSLSLIALLVSVIILLKKPHEKT